MHTCIHTYIHTCRLVWASPWGQQLCMYDGCEGIRPPDEDRRGPGPAALARGSRRGDSRCVLHEVRVTTLIDSSIAHTHIYTYIDIFCCLFFKKVFFLNGYCMYVLFMYCMNECMYVCMNVCMQFFPYLVFAVIFNTYIYIHTYFFVFKI